MAVARCCLSLIINLNRYQNSYIIHLKAWIYLPKPGPSTVGADSNRDEGHILEI